MISPSSPEGSTTRYPWAGLDALPDPVLITGTDGQLHFRNRAASAWFDFPAGGLESLNLRVLLHDRATGSAGPALHHTGASGISPATVSTRAAACVYVDGVVRALNGAAVRNGHG